MATTITKLRTAFGDYPMTAKLKSGELKEDGIELEFEEIKPVNRVFKPMAQDQKFDVAEMAIVTYLLARAYNKPIVLLPAVMYGRFQHNTFVYSAERGKLSLQDLPGKRIGVRSYTQTTGVWIRGIVENDYGVDLNKAHWTVQEGAHVAEYKDPPELNRVSMEHDLLKMLLAHPRYPSSLHYPVGPEALPSGHATAAMSLAMAGVLAAPRRGRLAAAVIGSALALGVGAAVIVVHWHYPSDVVAGYLLATGWALTVVAGLYEADRRFPARNRWAGSTTGNQGQPW